MQIRSPLVQHSGAGVIFLSICILKKIKNDNSVGMSATEGASTFLRLVDKGLAVIIGLISNFVFGIINIKSNRLEISLLVIIVFLLYASVDRLLRTGIKNLGILKYNKAWQDVLLSVLDFIMLLGIFLVIHLVLEFLETSLSGSNFDFFEVVVGVFSVVLIGFSIVQTIKIFS